MKKRLIVGYSALVGALTGCSLLLDVPEINRDAGDAGGHAGVAGQIERGGTSGLAGGDNAGGSAGVVGGRATVGASAGNGGSGATAGRVGLGGEVFGAAGFGGLGVAGNGGVAHAEGGKLANGGTRNGGTGGATTAGNTSFGGVSSGGVNVGSGGSVAGSTSSGGAAGIAGSGAAGEMAYPVQISAGWGTHTCARMSDGTVKCWGQNAYGVLGDGTKNDSAKPIVVPGLSNVVDVAAGHQHTCALVKGGQAYCWGQNDGGRLGDGTMTERLAPSPVTGTTRFGAIAAGNAMTCAIGNDTQKFTYCWGTGYPGNGSNASLVPVEADRRGTLQVAVSGGLLSTLNYVCEVLVGGEARCWGDNTWGTVGDGTTDTRQTAVSVFGVNTATQIATAADHACARLDGGSVVCWGLASNGGLGNGQTSSGVATSLVAVPVSNMSTATALASGSQFTCALLADATVQCWGLNSAGQLGTGATIARSTPSTVQSLGGVAAITAGNCHTCALTKNRQVYCWGCGLYADGSTVQYLPTLIDGF